MRFYTTAVTWFSPLVAGGSIPSAEIPADAQWHTVTLDLTKLCLFGDAEGFKASGNLLKNVFDIELRFSDSTAVKGDSGTVYVDDFQFAPKGGGDSNFILYNITTALTMVFKVFAKVIRF